MTSIHVIEGAVTAGQQFLRTAESLVVMTTTSFCLHRQPLRLYHVLPWTSLKPTTAQLLSSVPRWTGHLLYSYIIDVTFSMGFCPCTFRGKVNCLVSGRGWSTKERKTLTFSLFTNWWSADWVEWSAVLNRKWDLYDDKISWEWFTQPHMQSTLISLPISEKSTCQAMSFEAWSVLVGSCVFVCLFICLFLLCLFLFLCFVFVFLFCLFVCLFVFLHYNLQ